MPDTMYEKKKEAKRREETNKQVPSIGDFRSDRAEDLTKFKKQQFMIRQVSRYSDSYGICSIIRLGHTEEPTWLAKCIEV